jgi:ABC-2 type transport system permease protein
MKWVYVFGKGIREQMREPWILIITVVMAPLFIAIYFLMEGNEDRPYHVAIVNLDHGCEMGDLHVNLGDTLVAFLQAEGRTGELADLNFFLCSDRKSAVELLRKKQADVLVVIPEVFSGSIWDPSDTGQFPARLELVGDVTSTAYMVGAIWTEEMINAFVLEAARIQLPVIWTETTLGFSGARSEFELYVPGLLILSIIMIIFSASAAIVREPETRTLERLKISRLGATEFLVGTSLVQIIIALVSLVLALLAALALGYTLIPGSLGFILLISFLTALSMISFSLIVAAMCRSVKDVAIIGTFPLFLLMFFTGATFPVQGGKLFTLGGYDLMLNELLSPTWAVEALNKVLVRGQAIRETIPEMAAIGILTLLYFLLGTWVFRMRHMRAQ